MRVRATTASSTSSYTDASTNSREPATQDWPAEPKIPAATAIRASSGASSGESSDGFSSTALPAASAGATLVASFMIGEFHGVIAATTPNGSRTVNDT